MPNINKHHQQGWCLVMIVWGDMYDSNHVNSIVCSVIDYSPSCDRFVLITDVIRSDVSPEVRQYLIPEFFRHPRFYGGGYPIKLAAFGSVGLPENKRCVFVDLDTIITGDLAVVADLVEKPDHVAMIYKNYRWLLLSKVLHKLSGGRKYLSGNSSFVAFSSARTKSISTAFEQEHKRRTSKEEDFLWNDDRFISWHACQDLRYISPNKVCLFRREFMRKTWLGLYFSAYSAWTKKRRNQLVAMTFNDVNLKPHILANLKDGEKFYDTKKRFGIWSEKFIGYQFKKIKKAIQKIK